MRFRDLVDFVLIGCCMAGTLIVLACLIAGCRTDLAYSTIAPEGRTPKNQTAGSPKPALIVRPSSIL